MRYINFLVAVLLLAGCGKDVDGPNHSTSQRSRSAAVQPSPPKKTANEFFSHDDNGLLTVEGTLEGSWLRQRSGETLGDFSKATITDPLRIKVGPRSLPLVGMTEQLEHTLLMNSGKSVRLRGQWMSWIVDGRGDQNPQAGYTGPIPAHVVEFLIVSECEVIVTKAE